MTDLPCKDSRSISLRLHKEFYHYLKHLASKQSLEEQRYVSIGDLVRDAVKESFELPDNVYELVIEPVKKGRNMKQPNIRLWTDNTVNGYFSDLFDPHLVMVKG